MLYKVQKDGGIWLYLLGAWLSLLGPNPTTSVISGGILRMYRLETTGDIYDLFSLPFPPPPAGSPLPPPPSPWALIGNNPNTTRIVSGASLNLYQLRSDGTVLQYTGGGTSSWMSLDSSPAIQQIEYIPGTQRTSSKENVIQRLSQPGNRRCRCVRGGSRARRKRSRRCSSVRPEHHGCPSRP
jgi:hypothetical protein